MDTLVSILALESAARIPLEIATGLEELKKIFSEEARLRQEATEELWRRLAEAGVSPAPLPSEPRPLGLPIRQVSQLWLKQPSEGPRLQRFKAVWTMRVFENKKRLVVLLVLTTLSIWTSIFLGEHRWAQESQEQANLLLNDWQSRKIARYTAWFDQQTEAFAQERAQLLTEVSRQADAQAHQSLKPPAGVPTEPAATRSNSKRGSHQ